MPITVNIDVAALFEPISRVTTDCPSLFEPSLLLQLYAVLFCADTAIAASALQMYSWYGSVFTKAKPFVLPVFGLVPNACDAATLFAKVGFLVVPSIKKKPLRTPTNLA